MNNETIQKRIDEERAAILLGFNRVQLRRLCEEAGLTRAANNEESAPRLLTYEELYRLCRWVARPVT